MDAESITVGTLIVALLIVLGAAVWWGVFTSEPKWFILVGIGALGILVAGSILVASTATLWYGWAAAVLAAGGAIWGTAFASWRDRRDAPESGRRTNPLIDIVLRLLE